MPNIANEQAMYDTLKEQLAIIAFLFSRNVSIQL